MTRRQPGALWWMLVVLLGAAIVAAASLGAWQFVVKDAKPLDTTVNNAGARQLVVDAAKANISKVYSYKPDTFDQDIAAAEAVLTGDFLKDYRQSVEKSRDAATQAGVAQTAAASDGAIESMSGHRAAIIVLGSTSRTTRDSPTPQVTAFSFRVSMVKHSGTWLIDKLDPL
ncbi:MAG: Mce-associated rane protein [Mycobacterium sp.]|jgi:Mce-associated membrane protein|nr:Mce-associated rane protein [Mycobacterium sp.]